MKHRASTLFTYRLIEKLRRGTLRRPPAPIKSIANDLGMSEDAVKKMLYRIRKHLSPKSPPT